MSRLFQRLLKKRGVGKEFLKPKYEALPDPFLLPDMEKAVERILKAAEQGEKVIIYGDYDADGVTASAIMREILEMVGIPEIEVMLPDRFKDGYGMSERLVSRAKKEGASLVITVDCGSNNGEIISELFESGIEVVVTDHHELSSGVPEEAVAVVNPKRTDGLSELSEEALLARTELRELCGAGVAFFVAKAMTLRGRIPEGQEKWLLDLAAIGTVCDSMVLTGVNRVICYFGFIVISKTRRVGLRELLRATGVKTINTEAVGFQLGPRINAAGRLESAEIAFRLLTAKSAPVAAELSQRLCQLNEERKKRQTEATKEVEERGVSDEPVIVVSGDWHEGVLGIIAGRLSEKYRRPAFALTTKSKDEIKGSGRSFGDFNLASVVSACSEFLVSGGGHAEACGVKVVPGKLTEFAEAVNKYYRELGLSVEEQARSLEVAEDLAVSDLAEFSPEFIEELALLEPYGPGNAEPVFRLSSVFVLDVSRMGADGEHLRITIRDGAGKIMKLVAFYAREEWFLIRPGEEAEIWVSVMENEWNGLKTVEGRILRIEQ